jgi:hypothetical protein
MTVGAFSHDHFWIAHIQSERGLWINFLAGVSTSLLSSSDPPLILLRDRAWHMPGRINNPRQSTGGME